MLKCRPVLSTWIHQLPQRFDCVCRACDRLVNPNFGTMGSPTKLQALQTELNLRRTYLKFRFLDQSYALKEESNPREGRIIHLKYTGPGFVFSFTCPFVVKCKPSQNMGSPKESVTHTPGSPLAAPAASCASRTCNTNISYYHCQHHHHLFTK